MNKRRKHASGRDRRADTVTRQDTTTRQDSVTQDAELRSQALAKKFTCFSAFGFGGLLVWAFLSPVDATSVFQGEALAQNLFWLVLGVLSSAGAIWGCGTLFSKREVFVGCLALLWLILVSAMAGNGNNPRPAWHGFWQVIALASCYCCARGCVVGLRSRSALVSICLVGCVALAIHGFYQVGYEFQSARARYEENPDRELTSISLIAPAGSPERQRFESRLYSPEPYATFSLANSLATLLSAGLVLALGAAVCNVRTTSASSKTKMAEVASVGCLLVILGCWFLTRSRTAYVALAMAFAYWFLLNRSRFGTRALNSKVVASVGGAALMLLTVAAMWLLRNDRLVLSEAFKSLAFRLEYWVATLSMLREHGLFGVGLGNFQSYYPQYMLETASETIADPHNWLLDISATLSLPMGGLVAVWIIRNLVPPKRSQVSEAGTEQFADEHKVASELESWDALIAKFLYWGAGMGGSLCLVMLVLLTGLNPAGIAMAWGLAVLAGFAFQFDLRALIKLDPTITQTAAMVMVVCLLASGSWQASGLCVPLLVLLAAAGNASREAHPPKSPRYYLVGFPAVGLLCFIVQAWRPVSNSWVSMQLAGVAKSESEQMRYVADAIRQDPWDTDLLGWQVQQQAVHAAKAPRALFGEEAQAGMDGFETWLARDGNKYTNWRESGNLMLNLAAAAARHGLPTESFVARALSYYQNALRCYPTSVQLHAQLAAAAALDGQHKLVSKEIEEAVRLSQVTSHTDKMLKNQLVWLPLADVPAHLQAETPGWVQAEPLLNWLRTEQLRSIHSSTSK